MRLFGVDLSTPIKATKNHSMVKQILLNPKHLGGLHSTNSKNLKIMEASTHDADGCKVFGYN